MTLNRDQWNQFVLASPHHTFLHSWEWGQLQQKLGVSYWRLVLGESEHVQAVALVVKRPLPWGRSWLYLPRGPVFATGLTSQLKEKVWQQLQQRLRQLARQEHALFIRLDPAWPVGTTSELAARGWVKAEREVQPKDTIMIDLHTSEEELLQGMHHKTRYNIRVAQKHGVTARFTLDAAATETFLTLSRDVPGRSAFHYHPDAYYQAMRAAFSAAGNFAVAVAEQQGLPLAAHILVTFGDTTTYAHGASGAGHRQLMAPHLLQWESIRRAKQAGLSHYDFFGVAPPDAAATHPWAGITRFKAGFGGRREAYVGTYDCVLDRLGYAGFTLTRRVRKLWR